LNKTHQSIKAKSTQSLIAGLLRVLSTYKHQWWLYSTLGLLLLMTSCDRHADLSFTSWLKNQNFEFKSSGASPNATHYFTLQSRPLKIDTIFRSMQGPYDITEFDFHEKKEELIWLTGYTSKIINKKSSSLISDGYMCHNNLNISRAKTFPWQVKTQGTSIRLFTLTEGQVSVKLPDGFAIPIPAAQAMTVVSQVLNHNAADIDLLVSHDVALAYQLQSELDHIPIPLYQQAAFITKQVSGPEGWFGMPRLCNDHYLDSTKLKGDQPNHECKISYGESDYNPYFDSFGRTYSGHWKLPLKEQVLTTDVTKMLDLQFDTRIHYIGVHVHPFARSLELRDATLDTSLYIAHVENHDDKIGIKRIDSYSSEAGIPVYKKHTYELISTYECTDTSDIHTAMATMFLYLHDKK